MHALAALVARLRDDPHAVGLATALGWYVTKHALGVFSAAPPAHAFRDSTRRSTDRPHARARQL